MAMSSNEARDAMEAAAVKTYKDANGSLSMRQVCLQYPGITRSTMCRRMKGESKPRSVSHQHLQRLNPEEEDIVYKHVEYLIDGGFQVDIPRIVSIARQLLEEKHRQQEHYTAPKPLGPSWIDGFFKRHPDIAAKRVISLDRLKTEGTTLEALQKWFEWLDLTFKKNNIKPQNIYSSEEMNLKVNKSTGSSLLARYKNKRRHHVGQRGLATVVETISAIGRTVPPMIICKSSEEPFEGLTLLNSLPEDNSVRGSVLVSSEDSWSNEAHMITWLEHFANSTIPLGNDNQELNLDQLPDNKRVLMIDIHHCHESVEFLDICQANEIVLIRLPPRVSHLVRPLEGTLYTSMRGAFAYQVRQLSPPEINDLDGSEFIKLYSRMRDSVFSALATRNAFEEAGIAPLSLDKVVQRINASSASNNEGEGEEIDPDTDMIDASTAPAATETTATVVNDSTRSNILAAPPRPEHITSVPTLRAQSNRQALDLQHVEGMGDKRAIKMLLKSCQLAQDRCESLEERLRVVEAKLAKQDHHSSSSNQIVQPSPALQTLQNPPWTAHSVPETTTEARKIVKPAKIVRPPRGEFSNVTGSSKTSNSQLQRDKLAELSTDKAVALADKTDAQLEVDRLAEDMTVGDDERLNAAATLRTAKARYSEMCKNYTIFKRHMTGRTSGGIDSIHHNAVNEEHARMGIMPSIE